jgi:hypothetical protein
MCYLHTAQGRPRSDSEAKVHVLSKVGKSKGDFYEIKTSFSYVMSLYGRSQWLRRLRSASEAARLVGLVGSIPTGKMVVCLLRVLCVVR